MIDLDWRPIMNWYEHSELKMYDYITAWQPKNTRQRLFETIKYSSEPIFSRFKGGWGQEIMHWRLNEEQGFVWCTEARQEEIQQWVRDTVFNCAPGNE